MEKINNQQVLPSEGHAPTQFEIVTPRKDVYTMSAYKQKIFSGVLGIVSGLLVWLWWNFMTPQSLKTGLPIHTSEVYAFGGIFGLLSALYWYIEFKIGVDKLFLWLVSCAISFYAAFYVAIFISLIIDGSQLPDYVGSFLVFAAAGFVGMAVLISGFITITRLKWSALLTLLFSAAVVPGIAVDLWHMLENSELPVSVLFILWQTNAMVLFTHFLSKRVDK